MKSKHKQSEAEIKRLTDIIQDEVGFFNGWFVSEYLERASCELAEKKIHRYLKRRNMRLNKLSK